MQRLGTVIGALWLSALMLFVPAFVSWAWSADDAGDGRGLKPVAGDPPPRIYREVHALCIGIDRYKSAGIARLKWAEADANAVADMFEKRYGYQVQRLIGYRATRSAILDALEEYKKSLGPDDALVIFFAGHGQTIELDSYGRAGFLVPFDALLDLNDKRNASDWEQAAIDMRAIGKIVETLPARHVLMLADACYSGFLGRRSAFGQRVDLQELLRRPSRMVITAGTEEQQAIEVDQLQHGVFTHFLLEQLDNPWPSSATEVFVSIRNGVANKTDGKMLPQLREIVVENGEFVFLPKEIGNEDVAGVIKDVNRRINERAARRTELAHVIEAFEAPDYRYAVDAPEQKSRWEQKLKRFQDNASLGDPLAMAGLHYCYSRGLGVEPDPTRAYDWARRAYDSQHVAGKHVLGRCYFNGIGVPKNDAAGWKLVGQASQAGFAISKYLLARRELDRLADRWISSDPEIRQHQEFDERFVRLMTEASDEGVVTAKSALGAIYTSIDDFVAVEPNIATGMELVQTAAQAGHAQAQYNMFLLYTFEKSGWPNRDSKSAEHWLRRAADLGSAQAQFALASAHYQKLGYGFPLELPQDFSQARQWAQAAADQGNPEADLLLATLYEKGDGVSVDHNKAREHCEKAASAGLADAIARQAKWYFNGDVYDGDDAKAFQKSQEAARKGSGLGCYILGRCYESARGMPLDGEQPGLMKVRCLPHTVHWYTQAALRGVVEAKDKLKQWFGTQYPVRKTLGARFLGPGLIEDLDKEYPKTLAQLDEVLRLPDHNAIPQGNSGVGFRPPD